MKKYPSLKPGIWGAVVGAIAISVVGFSSFGGRSAVPPSDWQKSERRPRWLRCCRRSVSKNSGIRRTQRQNWSNSPRFPDPGTGERSSKRAAGRQWREAMFRTPRLSALAQNSSVLVCRSRSSSWQREAFGDCGSVLATYGLTNASRSACESYLTPRRDHGAARSILAAPFRSE